MLSEEVLKHLKQFSEERNQGRLGDAEWDAFLVYAHQEDSTDVDELRSYLSQEISAGDEVDRLVADYQRVGGLFRFRDELGPRPKDGLREPKEPAYFLSSDLTQPARPGGSPVGIHIREDEEGQGARSLSCSLSPEMRKRNPHMLIVGNEGTGKTELMTNMVVHDIEAGDKAVVLIDNDGSLTDAVAARLKVAAHGGGADKLLVITPGDSSFSYNPIALPGEDHAVVSALVRSFKSLGTGGWNQHSENILRNSLLLLRINNKNMQELEPLLMEADVREQLISHVEEREDAEQFATLLVSWDNYRRLSKTPPWLNRIEPILSVLRDALKDTDICKMLAPETAGTESSLLDLLEQKRPVAFRLEKNRYGIAGALFQSLLISSVQCCVDALRAIPGALDMVSPPAIYLDEMSGVLDKDALSHALEKRPVRYGIVASTCSVVREDITDMLSAFGTIAAFAVNEQDAEALSRILLSAELQGSQEEKANIQKLMEQKGGQFYWRPGNRSSAALSMIISERELVSNRA